MTRIALALEAMATRFELVLAGPDPPRLRAAGEEALAEVERAEAQLSRYRPSSQISCLNARAGGAPVRLDRSVFGLLSECVRLWRLTDGAFDVTVGPLLRAWGFVGGGGTRPAPRERERARTLMGMERLELDASTATARLAVAGMELDLGAIGKGYALDRAIAVLEEHGVGSALLHGGTSSVHTVGRPAEGPWRVAWRRPDGQGDGLCLGPEAPALAVSAAHGKGFADGAVFQGHVLDPRRGEPTRAAATACVRGRSSLLCDALSTALLVHGPAWRTTLSQRFPGHEGWTAPLTT
ncbi:MAG TPA: FAD:protein FMN transferase [Vicinamibacteria bacterium]|nr:FAD:protein FMN transferase [Vicinamibacteria bacterium]